VFRNWSGAIREPRAGRSMTHDGWSAGILRCDVSTISASSVAARDIRWVGQPPSVGRAVQRRQRLGGMLSYHHRAANLLGGPPRQPPGLTPYSLRWTPTPDVDSRICTMARKVNHKCALGMTAGYEKSRPEVWRLV
jgi:hypothetical protein